MKTGNKNNDALWCDNCNSKNEKRLECLRGRSLCEWCNKSISPPSLFHTVKNFAKITDSKELVIKIECPQCGVTQAVLLSGMPSFGDGHFIDMSDLDNLMCRYCFMKPVVTILCVKKK